MTRPRFLCRALLVVPALALSALAPPASAVSATAAAALAVPRGHLLLREGVGGAASVLSVDAHGRGSAVPGVGADVGVFSYSPDGVSFVYNRFDSSKHDAYGNEASVVVLRDANGTERVLTAGHPFAFDPAWSPDGRSVAYAGNDGLHLITLATGADRYLPGTRNGNRPSFAPDSRRLSFFTFDGNIKHLTRVYTLDTHTGARREIGLAVIARDPAPNANRAPQWSPDGKTIAFDTRTGVGPDAQRVAVVHPDGSGLRLLPASAAYAEFGPLWTSASTLVVAREPAQKEGATVRRTDIVAIGLDGSTRVLFTVHGPAGLRGYTPR